METTCSLQTTPRTFFLVDDHAMFRSMVRKFLPGPDPVVIECANGSEAIKALDQTRPDWILMDIEMPGMDGLETTRNILARCPATRIVILTQYNDLELRKTAEDAGVYGYVLKDQLHELREILEGKKLHSPLMEPQN